VGGTGVAQHGVGGAKPAEDKLIPDQEEPSGHHTGPEVRTQRREVTVAQRVQVVQRVVGRSAPALPVVSEAEHRVGERLQRVDVMRAPALEDPGERALELAQVAKIQE